MLPSSAVIAALLATRFARRLQFGSNKSMKIRSGASMRRSFYQLCTHKSCLIKCHIYFTLSRCSGCLLSLGGFVNRVIEWRPNTTLTETPKQGKAPTCDLENLRNNVLTTIETRNKMRTLAGMICRVRKSQKLLALSAKSGRCVFIL